MQWMHWKSYMLAARGPSFNGLTVGVMRPAGHLFFLDYLLNEMDALKILYVIKHVN